MNTLPNNVLLESFVRLADAAPGVPVLARPGEEVSRARLIERARALAGRLDALGDLRGSPLVLSAPNGPAFFVGLLASWLRGGVPILADHASPPAEIAGVARRLDACATLASSDAWSLETEAWRLEAREGAHRRAGRWPAGAIKLSSGSTGQAKGILVRAEALAADDSQLRAVMGIEASERLLVAIPLSHSYGMGSLVAPALAAGATLVMPEHDAGLFAPLEAARVLGAHVFPTVPAYLKALLELPDAPPWPEPLRLVITAGAPLPPETARHFRERFGRPVHVFYGSSETGGISYDARGDSGEAGRVGTPIPGVEVTLETGGRVVVRSPALAERYLPHEDERLAEGRFLTGDLGRFEEGELRLVGRVDDQVNVRGKKVSPREVEEVLSAHPLVDEVAVLGIDDPASGTERLRAVVAAKGGALRYRELASWCRARLAPHKVPRSIVFVEALPRTSRGKLDRDALAILDGASR